MFLYMSLGNEGLGVIPKAKEVKGKVNKYEYIKLESLTMGNRQ